LLPGDPNANEPRPTSSERWGQWGEPSSDEEDTKPHKAVRLDHVPNAAAPPPPWATQASQREEALLPPSGQQQPNNAEFIHREHVTGALPVYPSEAPLFRPSVPPYPAQASGGAQFITPQGQGYLPPQQWQGYPPPQVGAQFIAPQGYPNYQNYPGYPSPYPPSYTPYIPYAGYNGYAPYGWQPPRPKQDGYRLAIVITSLVGSVLALLGGLASVGILLLFLIGTAANPNARAISDSQYFSGLLTFIAFAMAGLAGGGFGIYHSIRGLLKKPSASFRLPWFWIFLVLYLFVLGIGYALQANGQAVTNLVLTISLIILAAIFPAFTLLALGVRRLRFPEWPTSWRRFAMALGSGATLGIGLALILELGLLFLVVRGGGPQSAANFQKCIDNPDLPGCGSFTAFDIIFLVVAIIGPMVEETVKPLAVALYIGRMRSPSEAFVLGMSSGIGFALVETVGYIGMGYQDWLTVALERTGAGLLHGFGAGMVALGWYYLTHAQEQRLLKAFGCWAYAVFQHFVWNGTAVLSYLPGPVGTAINSWNVNLGFVTLPFVEILNIFEAIFILIFFFYITGRLRKSTPTPTGAPARGASTMDERTPVQASYR